MANRALQVSTLLLIAGCGSAPVVVASPGSGSTGGAEGVAKPMRSALTWKQDAPFAGEAAPPGAVDFVTLADGSFVVAHSYGSEAEPFVLLRGKKGELSKSKAPWTCAGGPAEIDVSGGSLWVHCMGPEEPPRVHFWHSADRGDTWMPVGALHGAIALGSYVMAGDRLYLTGKFEGQSADLHVLSRGSTGKFAHRTTNMDRRWPEDVQMATVAAAPDGSAIALLGLGKYGVLWIAASTDGGATLRSIWGGAPESKSPELSASIEGGVLTFINHQEGGPYGVAKFDLLADRLMPLTSHFDAKVEDACAYGSHVVARFKSGRWAISSDTGASFADLQAPQAEEMAPLACSPSGARYGSQFLAW